MHDNSALVEQRIRRELFERVLPAVYSARVPLHVRAWDVPGEPVSFADAVAALATHGRPFNVGERWSRPWGTTWFQLDGDAAGYSEAVIDLGFRVDTAGFQAEGLVWTTDGEPLQGVHPRRTSVALPAPAGPLRLFIEAASNPAFSSSDVRTRAFASLATAGEQSLYTLREASLVRRNDEVFQLLLDVEVLLGLITSLPTTSKRRQRVLRELEAAFNALDLNDVAATAVSARNILRPALALSTEPGGHRVIAVGHAHIDSAWLWPMRETVRKCARTFASATRMMDDYPEFRFACSQAAQYQWIEQRYPTLFERIRERVGSGQWQPVGGMWVEADMNLPNGESLARQLIYGQRYFQSRFGMRCKEAWLPDVFGYPASLPQIFRAGGCDRFVTQKLSWNKTNRFPHSTFWWEGLDGSRVLTHFPPVDTYNATVVGSELLHCGTNFREHGWSDWSLMPFGHGNGGGGPTREMIERVRRFADLAGAPQVQAGTVDEFFAHVEAETVSAARVPVWNGELYFEMHRGTLTSQARTKVGNRRCEQLLREAELWWASVPATPPEVSTELDDLWKDVLVQQFHDILPGSSITWVHDDAEAVHARVIARVEELIAQALQQLAPTVPAVANGSQYARCEVIGSGADAFVASVQGFGIATRSKTTIDDHVAVTEHSFTNRSVSVAWGHDGAITSIIDLRAGRQLLPVGKAVTVDLAPDHPIEYDAWDLEEWTGSRAVALSAVESCEIIEAGQLAAVLRVIRRFGHSTLTQDLTVRAGSARVDLTFDVDWQEEEKLLSLMVPLDVHAREAACDIQFGHVMRPTHASNSWDAAKFEVCAHRYVDLSEPGFGVAVLNDGRYGHGVQDGGIRVSLLRAARFPDPVQDRGRHRVTISVLPHGSGLHDVLRAAEALNTPLRLLSAGAAASAPAPIVSVEHAGVQVSSVKRADDGSGDLIVRLAEVCGNRVQVPVRTPGRITAAHRCNLMEEPQSAVDVADGFVNLTLRPFELVTLRLLG